ncbi:MAG: GDSL-type esterase/lipase family protein [Armatimonadota bacterium]
MRTVAILPGIAVAASATATAATLENLALNRPFTCTSPNDGGWDGLVDGVRDSDRRPGCFATGGEEGFPKSVTIDLGAVCRVSRVDVLNSLNGNTRTVEIYVSTNGRKFVLLRTYVFPRGRLQTLTHKFPLRPVRFIKIAFRDTYGGGYGGDNFMYLREVEVWGEPRPVATNDDLEPLMPPMAPRWLKVFRRYALGGRQPLHIVAIGDYSVLPPEGRPEVRAFPVLLMRRLYERYSAEGSDAELTVHNVASPDNTAAAAVAGLDDVIRRKPDVVLVCLGLTDSLVWNKEHFTLSLNKLVERLKDQTDAAIILISPPPIVDDPNVPHDRRAAGRSCEEAAGVVRAVAVLHGVPLVDTAAAFAESEVPPSELYADSLHLTQRAQELIAEKVLELLE